MNNQQRTTTATKKKQSSNNGNGNSTGKSKQSRQKMAKAKQSPTSTSASTSTSTPDIQPVDAKMKKRKKEQTIHQGQDITNQMLGDILDELVLKFILNCPPEEYESFDRLFFQFEEAYWYYEDFLKGRKSQQKHQHQHQTDNNNNSQCTLPHLTFEQFTDLIFSRVPSLEQHREAVSAYTQSFFSYKHSVPVFGAILVNEQCNKVLLLQSYNSKSGNWGFPRGKINKGESELECAVREVYEEVGYNLEGKIREDWFVQPAAGSRRHMKLFIAFNVKEQTQFRTQTRNEIGKIQWHSIQRILQTKSSNTPAKNNYFLVRPFIRQLVQQPFYKDFTSTKATLPTEPPNPHLHDHHHHSQIQQIPEFSGGSSSQSNVMDMLTAAVSAATTMTTPKTSRKSDRSIHTTPSYNSRRQRHRANKLSGSDSDSDGNNGGDRVSPVSFSNGMKILNRPVAPISHSLGHNMTTKGTSNSFMKQFESPKRTKETGTRKISPTRTLPTSQSFSEGSFMSFAFDVDDILQE